jgi:uncharacterized protein YlxP (DUF503 family)
MDGKKDKEERWIMTTLSAKLTFYIPGAASIKDKRQVCRSLIDKTRHKFNASVAEVDTQDIHQTLTIGIAVVSGEVAHAQTSLDGIIRFMESHTDAELINVEDTV